MTLAGLLAIILLAAGCVHAPASVSSADQNSGQRRAGAELQDAKTEAMTLRADLAAARIAAAKQEAELRELRRQVTELQQILDAKHAELIGLREERDRLAKSATIAQVRVADPSALPASAADVNALQIRLHEMESALAALTAELAQMKKAVVHPSPASSPARGEEKR
jgi:chromosome segregation ATPase